MKGVTRRRRAGSRGDAEIQSMQTNSEDESRRMKVELLPRWKWVDDIICSSSFPFTKKIPCCPQYSTSKAHYVLRRGQQTLLTIWQLGASVVFYWFKDEGCGLFVYLYSVLADSSYDFMYFLRFLHVHARIFICGVLWTLTKIVGKRVSSRNCSAINTPSPWEGDLRAHRSPTWWNGCHDKHKSQLLLH